MNTKDWGPKMWYSLHTIAYNYEPTPENRKHYKQFYVSLKDMLPCKYCRQSWKDFLTELPIDKFLDSKKSMTFWIYLMHNKVNKKLRDQGNPIPKDPSYEEICKKYEAIRADCSNPGLTCSKKSPGSNDTLTRLPFIALFVFSLYNLI